VLLLLAVQSSDWLWVVYVASFVQASLGQFFGPARNAFIPSLVPAEELTAANALDGLSIQTAGLVAPALGGALTAGFGLAPVILLDSASFLVSAALIAMVRAKGSAPVSQGDANQAGAGLAAWEQVWDELRDGLVVVRRERTVWAVFLVVSLAWLGQGIINALIVPFVKDVLGGNAQMFGWTYTAQAVGGVLGGLLVGQITGRIRPAQAMTVGGLGVGLVFLAIVSVPRFLVQAGVPPWPVVLALYAVGGVAVMALFVPHITLLQQSVPARFQGRVFATLSTSTTVATVLGLGIGGIAGLAIGPVPVLSLAAALYGLGGIAALLVPKRGLVVMT
jgi:MFS family permease